MFNKKLIRETVESYQTSGIVPDIWGKGTEELDNFTKIAFIMIFEKSFDAQKKQLKAVEEDNLTSDGLKNKYFIISFKSPYTSKVLNPEGKVFLETNYPAYMDTRDSKSSYTWKLR